MCSGRSAPTAAMCMGTSACWWGVCLGARTPDSCACSWLPSPRGCPLPARRSPPLGLFAQAKPRVVYEIFTTKQRSNIDPVTAKMRKLSSQYSRCSVNSCFPVVTSGGFGAFTNQISSFLSLMLFYASFGCCRKKSLYLG
uniref:Uncharacterized protein n=1 Tax=Triticum urartu TaxID=4572 RepID=A0A8R7TKF6_TRIUA